ncbi:hypothetical protein MmiHf6_16360 [Methanimicrococcus hongohii]|uniref:Uncharacterized protein n=1 Tax=Methanimicrococcus hongohii TaxID=3028295 RepID=A0AA96ZTA0_9EURY|nr:hypothetical protein [Methanimicrococcus sp. Hf6]WNY24305.1 hypothetical protein MmiHf6_16360 [Methanimicrococcus sp. Hf6]
MLKSKVIFRLSICLILCAVLFAGCLSNDSGNSVIPANNDAGVFSGTITSAVVSEDSVLLIVENENETRYSRTNMVFILNNETENYAENTDAYQSAVNKFIFVRYVIPDDGNLSTVINAASAELFEEGEELLLIRGTVEKITLDADSEGKGSFRLNAANGTPIDLSYNSSTYIAENIPAGSNVTVYAGPYLMESYPLQGWVYEVWLN